LESIRRSTRNGRFIEEHGSPVPRKRTSLREEFDSLRLDTHAIQIDDENIVRVSTPAEVDLS